MKKQLKRLNQLLRSGSGEGLQLGTIHLNLINKIFWLEKRAISNIGKSETHSDKKIGGKRNQVLSQKNVTLDKPEVLIFFIFSIRASNA